MQGCINCQQVLRRAGPRRRRPAIGRGPRTPAGQRCKRQQCHARHRVAPEVDSLIGVVENACKVGEAEAIGDGPCTAESGTCPPGFL